MAAGADWLFLFGSILFALKPTIDVIRSAHLERLPGQSLGPPTTHRFALAVTADRRRTSCGPRSIATDCPNNPEVRCACG
jgi:hypothetical protein